MGSPLGWTPCKIGTDPARCVARCARFDFLRFVRRSVSRITRRFRTVRGTSRMGSLFASTAARPRSCSTQVIAFARCARICTALTRSMRYGEGPRFGVGFVLALALSCGQPKSGDGGGNGGSSNPAGWRWRNPRRRRSDRRNERCDVGRRRNVVGRDRCNGHEWWDQRGGLTDRRRFRSVWQRRRLFDGRELPTQRSRCT